MGSVTKTNLSQFDQEPIICHKYRQSNVCLYISIGDKRSAMYPKLLREVSSLFNGTLIARLEHNCCEAVEFAACFKTHHFWRKKMLKVLAMTALVGTTFSSCRNSMVAQAKTVELRSINSKLKHSYVCTGKVDGRDATITVKNGRSGTKEWIELEMSYQTNLSRTIFSDLEDLASGKGTTLVEDMLGLYLNMGSGGVMLAPMPLSKSERRNGRERENQSQFRAIFSDLDSSETGKLFEVLCKIN